MGHADPAPFAWRLLEAVPPSLLPLRAYRSRCGHVFASGRFAT